MKEPEFHGMVGTPEYISWYGMIARCENTNHISYAKYGGKGIAVCERWRSSFLAFYEDMGPKPTPEYTLERIRNGDGYQPDNCRWATRLEQARNRSTNRLVCYNGEMITIAELSVKTSIGSGTLTERLNRGCSVEEAIVPVRNLLTYNGQSKTLKEWAAILNIDYHVLYYRVMVAKWPLERAFK